jgi:hypothetical protein
MVDLAGTHVRSICLGWPYESDLPGSNTSSCDSDMDPPPSEEISYVSYVSTSDL